MKIIVVAALAAIGSSGIAPVDANDVNEVIRNLDLTSFPNSLVGRRSSKTTFEDYGFVTVEKTTDRAKLVRKEDGRSKSFVVIANRGKRIDLCFHDRFVVMPADGASPLRYHNTSALIVSKSPRGKWTAQQAWGGFPNCRNDPPETPRQRAPA